MLLNFRLGTIPVRVHGSFWLVIACLGLPVVTLGLLLQWIAVVFVGVLLHELGHALVGRSFGLTPQIDLIGFGGLTSWSAREANALSPAKRIAISLAGPFTGITIGIPLLVFVRIRLGLPPFAFFDGQAHLTPLVRDIVFVNAGWGLLNLLPVLPMDGGNVLLQSLNWLTKGRGEKPARTIATVTAVLLAAIAFWYFHSIYGACLAGLFAVQNVQALRAASLNDGQVRAHLKAGFDALERGMPPEAIRIANEVLARTVDPGARTDAVRLLAFGYLLSRAWGDLVVLMESPASSLISDDEMAKFEQAARELERPEEADRIAAVMRTTRARPFPTPPTTTDGVPRKS